MGGLTPASADDLPPLGELLVDDPFWQYPAWGLVRERAEHLRVWATAAASPGYLAVVTETGGLISVTESGTSGPPNRLKRTAFITRFELDPGRIRPDSSNSPVGLANR